MVRERGVEPPRPCGRYHLKVVRLPFRHSRLYNWFWPDKYSISGRNFKHKFNKSTPVAPKTLKKRLEFRMSSC